MSKEKYETMRRLRAAEGDLAYSLDCFGDALAKRQKYKTHDGLDAIHFYLIEKYRWLPSQVRSLNWDDLRFLMAEEMSGWTLPKEARLEPSGRSHKGSEAR